MQRRSLGIPHDRKRLILLATLPNVANDPMSILFSLGSACALPPHVDEHVTGSCEITQDSLCYECYERTHPHGEPDDRKCFIWDVNTKRNVHGKVDCCPCITTSALHVVMNGQGLCGVLVRHQRPNCRLASLECSFQIVGC